MRISPAAPGIAALRIAIPLLSVTTPVGVVWGLVEAYRFHPWLAVLMSLLLAVVGGFIGMTLRQIRKERRRKAPEERAKDVSSYHAG